MDIIHAISTTEECEFDIECHSVGERFALMGVNGASEVICGECLGKALDALRAPEAEVSERSLT